MGGGEGRGGGEKKGGPQKNFPKHCPGEKNFFWGEKKEKIDDSGNGYQIGNALNALPQNIVYDSE